MISDTLTKFTHLSMTSVKQIPVQIIKKRKEAGESQMSHHSVQGSCVCVCVCVCVFLLRCMTIVRVEHLRGVQVALVTSLCLGNASR